MSSSDAPVSREGLNAVLLCAFLRLSRQNLPSQQFVSPSEGFFRIKSANKTLFNCTLAAKVVFVKIFWHTQTVAAGLPVKYSLKCGSQGGGRWWFCWVRVSPVSAIMKRQFFSKMLLYPTIHDSFGKKRRGLVKLTKLENYSYPDARASLAAAKTAAAGLSYCLIAAAVGGQQHWL